jgi:riboflavin synthase
MFTGIVTAIGRISAVSGAGSVRRVRISAGYDASTIDIGASIACGGPCLTVVAREPDENGCWFEVDAAAETLDRTTVGSWRVGTRINLERSLRIGDELGGHLVTGHVDGKAPILERETITGADTPWGPTARFVIEAPAKLAGFIAEKGSVCLDGTSLTVNSVLGRTFSVLLIPHTLNVTTWGERRVGDLLNLEVDLMARYAARLAEASRGE